MHSGAIYDVGTRHWLLRRLTYIRAAFDSTRRGFLDPDDLRRQLVFRIYE